MGCVLKDDYAYLAHMMTTLGGWFHTSGHPAKLCALLRSPQGSLRLTMARAFLPAWQDSLQAQLMKNWDDLREYILALPPEQQITPQAFSGVADRFLPGKTTEIDAALATTKPALAALNIPQTDQGRLLILTLIYGHRFYADPLKSWASLTPAKAINAAWKACFSPAS